MESTTINIMQPTNDRETRKIYEKLLLQLKKLRFTHNRASEFYGRRNKYLLFPSITTTLLISILAIFITSDILDENDKRNVGIASAIVGLISTSLQTISAALAYGTKQDTFTKSANDYDELITATEFEILNPAGNDDTAFRAFMDDMEAKIKQIQQNCPLPPTFIYKEWTQTQIENKKNILELEDKYNTKIDISSNNTMTDTPPLP